MYVPACGTRHINKTLAVCKGLNYSQQIHLYIKRWYKNKIKMQFINLGVTQQP